MITAYFHRAYWCYENNLGIAKIHYEPLGIFAILFESGIPKINVNFLDNQEFSYYWQKYRKAGMNLLLGVQIDRDVELTRVIEKNNIFKFPEINLEVKLENNIRSFRTVGAEEWIEFQDDVFVEYQPCKSLIHVI
ncbi:hypothetical protein [aff. Roholtiella sp. LEGE 12411]|uniref:hypothetical protein n=1 Tax=aff. Roholtiella sp. LEGE 12411 TaxID=1828822 RepID=UPI00187FAF62|nr:hypothetical protein [aff. Roholtiella sp. LEGE 12411]MBE9038868.1 hypothetical protein [aff. Roholtiella sp. LEGE 12411]